MQTWTKVQEKYAYFTEVFGIYNKLSKMDLGYSGINEDQGPNE